jgi:hypothetical protein
VAPHFCLQAILSISSRARSWRSSGTVSIVGAEIGTRYVLRTMVEEGAEIVGRCTLFKPL